MKKTLAYATALLAFGSTAYAQGGGGGAAEERRGVGGTSGGSMGGAGIKVAADEPAYNLTQDFPTRRIP